jgi:ATP-binding cassette, subfamily C, type I secretion system permease/ATPase
MIEAKTPSNPMQNPLDLALRNVRSALGAVLFFSMCINLLMLTSPMYMLQIYDRVLVSRNPDTLILLTIVATIALITYGILQYIRGSVLVRISGRIDNALSSKVFTSVLNTGKGVQSFKDLDAVRGFLTGNSLLSLFDAPWTPLYIALVYYLHPLLGHVVLVGAIVLLVLAVSNEFITRKLLQISGVELSQANRFAEISSHNRDAIQAMGMLPGLTTMWRRWHDRGIALQALASDRMSLIAGSAKFVRIYIQIGILGVGAYLAINEFITPGVMIAASIIGGRALSPVEQAITGWRSFLLARQSRTRLQKHLAEFALEKEKMPLPDPKGDIVFDNVYAKPPGSEKMVVSGVNFKLDSGTVLGITGPSAAGKSSIARLLVGVWKPLSGHVRLDQAELIQWENSQLGPHIGYLPQDVELFAGTVAENIARFGDMDPEAVVDAAKLAGANETILTLSNGYDTFIGADGENLSGGQRQRIGIARAFYRFPALIILDEPTSNLDATGEALVRQALQELKNRGSTVVVIAHRPTLIGGVDLLLVVQQGTVSHFGPVSEVLPQITRRINIGSTIESAKAEY